MAVLDITYVGSGAWATGAASPAPAYPTGLASGDKLYCLIHSRESTVVLPSTHGPWTKIEESVIGSGTVGAGTGPTRFTVYEADAAGTESGTYSFGSIGTAASAARIHALRAPAGATGLTWGRAFAIWNHASSTNIGGTTTTSISVAAKDMILVGVGSPDDTTLTLTISSLSATGITFGSVSGLADISSATGNDHSVGSCYVPVTAGSATAAITVAGTADAAETGGGILLRVRLDGTPAGSGGGGGTGQVTFRTPTVIENQTASIVPDMSTCQTGDCALLSVACDANINLPTGWTDCFPQIDQAVNCRVFYRFLDGTSNDNPTVTTTSGTRLSAIVLPCVGVDTTTPLDGVTPSEIDVSSAASSINVPSITTNTDGGAAITGFAIDASNATYQGTLTWTGGSEVAQTTGTGRRQEMGTKSMATAGATGTATWAQTGGALNMVGYQLALKPAPASAADTTKFFFAAA